MFAFFVENEVKEVKRQDSNSSHTSISSEKAPALSSAAKSTPIPVPLPRTSKSPVDSKQINDRQNENELAEVSYESDNDVQLKDVEESSDDEDNETINTDIIKVQHVVHTDSSESEDAKVIKDISLTLHDKNLSPAETTLVVSSLQESEIDVQHYPADEATNSPGVVDNDVANEHEESVPLDKVDEFSDNLDSLPSSLALSRRSSGENREDEDGLPLGFESQMTSDVQREVDGEDLNDDLDEDNTIVESGEPENQAFSPAFINDAVNEFYNESNWQKDLIAKRWAELASTTNQDLPAGDEWVTSDDEGACYVYSLTDALHCRNAFLMAAKCVVT